MPTRGPSSFMRRTKSATSASEAARAGGWRPVSLGTLACPEVPCTGWPVSVLLLSLPLAMAVALGEAGVKTVEDVADLSTDEVRGGFEQRGAEKVRVPGALEAFTLSVQDAESLILNARVALGWIEAPEAIDIGEQPEFAEEGEDVATAEQ